MKILCDIYKSKNNEELYLYVDKAEKFARVPGELLAQVNTEKITMSLVLTEARKLARADISKVMSDIREKGFYLQLPPLPVSPASGVDQC